MQINSRHYLFPLIFASLIFSGMTLGCAVDNEFIAKWPGFEARSDKIPGLMPSQERIEIIRKKGEAGRKALAEEQAILLAQLMHEYETAPAMNLKREAVDAMGKIQHRDQFGCLREVLNDTDVMIRISALEAIGQNDLFNDDLLSLLIEYAKRDPDKDVRVVAINRLGQIGERLRKQLYTPVAKTPAMETRIYETLAECLYDKQTIIRYEAMQTLGMVTGLDYGSDIDRWMKYVQYRKGESRELPKERTLTERLPRIQLPMFK